MFDLYHTDRIKAWKEFRESLEEAEDPFQEVALFWSRAPFVSQYLKIKKPSDWPDPWQLILDGKFDDLAIALGMCYTLQLTDRFKDHKFEIHMAMSAEDMRHILVVNDQQVLNWEYRHVTSLADLPQTIKIWPTREG